MDWVNIVVAALIGGLITAIGFLYKRRIETVVVFNKSLYQLLTLYRSVRFSAVKPSFLTSILVEVLQEMFPDSKNDPLMEDTEKYYNDIFSDLFLKVSEPEEHGLLEMYLGAVESLSALDPVLAYRLSANAGLKRYLVVADEKTKKLRDMAASELSDKDMAFVKSCHDEATDMVSKDVLHQLKKDLLLLSMRCGIFQFVAVVRRMRRNPGVSDEEVDDIKANIRALIEKQIRAYQTQH